MSGLPKKIQTWQMVQPYAKDKESGEQIEGKLERVEIEVPELGPEEVLVEVAGCGVCHTDLGYFYDGVPTVNKPPLTLGHEISGTVVAGDKAWLGKEVIIPAVMPCRKCELCKTGRGNRCLNQKMPGSSMGIYGGFSSHIPVPSIDLCAVGDRGDIALSHLAVVADAATTPYQAIQRSRFERGDHCIVIGVGGVGQYLAQQLKALGAKTVLAIDVNEQRLQSMRDYGVDGVVNARDKSSKEVANEVKAYRKEHNLPAYGWKVFESSGTRPGQETGLALLSFTGKLIIVGFGPHKVDYMLSRVMAFDAEIIGTWGCLPEYYPKVLDLVLSKKITLEDFVQLRPMSRIAEAFAEAHATPPEKRIILTPDF